VSFQANLPVEGFKPQKLKRVRLFKTFFKTNNEELENLNSFQNLIFINKVPPPRRCRPGPRPCYATDAKPSLQNQFS